MHVCIYIYIYAYVNIYIYICTYIYTQNHKTTSNACKLTQQHTKAYEAYKN